MAVLAEYRAPAPPGNAVRLGIDAYETGASIMQRKQRLRLEEQQQELQRMEFIAKLPLLEAQIQNERLSAAAAVQAATDRVHWKSKFAVESVTANRRFQEVMAKNVANENTLTPAGSSDADQEAASKEATRLNLAIRAQDLRLLAAEYVWMDQIPEGKGFVGTLNKAAADATAAEGINAQVERYLAVAGINKQGRVESETIKAGAKASSAETYTASRERIAALQANTKLTLQERDAQIASEKKGAVIEDLLQRAAEADQAAAQASAAKNERAAAKHREVASGYRDAVQKETTFAGQAPLEVPKESPPLQPKPKPIDSGPSPEISVTIPGSDLPPSNAPLANPPEEAAPTPTPTEAATKPETSHPAPIKVRDWNQAKALKPGTKYVGPDGILYTRGK